MVTCIITINNKCIGHLYTFNTNKLPLIIDEAPLQAISPVCGTAKGENLTKVCKLLKCPVQVKLTYSSISIYIVYMCPL